MEIFQRSELSPGEKHDLIVFPELDFKVHIDDWVAIAGA